MKLVTNNYTVMSLCENSQNADHKLWLANVLNGEVQAVSQPFKCREYYGDALFTIHTGIRVNEYRFDTAKTGWLGEHVLTAYNQKPELVLGKLKILNETLRGTSPMIRMVEVDISNVKNGYDLGCGFLIKVPKWYHKTIVRSSLFTALLRTLWYKNPLDVRQEDSYAESCVSQMHRRHWPKGGVNNEPHSRDYKDGSLWNSIFYPALGLRYKNCMGMNDADFKQCKAEVKDRKYYYVHASSGIYTMWNNTQSYLGSEEVFDQITNLMVNKDVLGNLLAIESEQRVRKHVV